MKKILLSILCVLLLLTLFSGCYKNADVLIIDDYPIYPGLYLYFQLQSISIASTKLEDQYEGKELYNQSIDGIPVREWIKNNTVTLAQEYVFIEKSFDRLGLDQAVVDMQMNYYDSTLRDEWQRMQLFYVRNGVGFSTFRKAYQNYIKSDQLFTALYMTEGGEEEVPEEVIKNFFAEDFTYLDYLCIDKTDEDKAPLTDTRIQKIREDMKIIKNIAEEAVKEEDVLFYDPVNIGIEAAFRYYCEINEITEEEAASIRGKAITENTIVRTSSKLYDEGLLETIFKSTYDRFYTYETEDSFYLFCRRSMLAEDEDAWVEYKGTIISELMTDTYLEYLSENSKLLPVVENAGARRYFSINKASD